MLGMLDLIVAILCALSPSAGADLRGFDPVDLTDDTVAAEHVWSARVAAVVAGVDVDDVLALAWHESRFTSNVVSHEPGNRVSCGVLTPEPVARCVPRALVDQYLAGARHLRVWRDAVRGDRWTALVGLAGGYAAIAGCARRCGVGAGVRVSRRARGDRASDSRRASHGRRVRPRSKVRSGKPSAGSTAIALTDGELLELLAIEVQLAGATSVARSADVIEQPCIERAAHGGQIDRGLPSSGESRAKRRLGG